MKVCFQLSYGVHISSMCEEKGRSRFDRRVTRCGTYKKTFLENEMYIKLISGETTQTFQMWEKKSCNAEYM